MSSSPATSDLAAFSPATEFLPALLDLLQEGVIGYTPLLDEAGAVVDFAFAYLNPAAQRQLGLPAQPATTYCQQFPASRPNGAFAFHCATYQASEPQEFTLSYQVAGYDKHFRARGQRLGEKLIVTLTDAADHPRLPAGQAREAAAHATAERARLATAAHARAEQQLQQLTAELEARVREHTAQLEQQHSLLRQILWQVPAAVATLSAPEYRLVFFNNQYHALSAGRAAVGLVVGEVFPEAATQGFMDLLHRVHTTGEPFVGADVPAQVRDLATGQLAQRYLNLTFQPLRDGQGQVQAILTFILDTTEAVLTRRQTDTLQAAMLAAAQRQAQQREDLYQVFEQTPAAVALLRGPQHTIEYANPAYAQFFPGQHLRGRPLAEAHPRAQASGVRALLDHVYQTGETYVGQERPVKLAQPEGQPPALHYFNFTYSALREAGYIVGISIFAYEVTEQVLARQRVEASQYQLRIITDALPVLISYLDREQRYCFANYAYQEWFNHAPASLLGQQVREVIGEPAYQSVRHYLAHALAGERVEFEAQMPYRDGFTRHIHTTYLPDVQAGRVAGCFALVTDITDQVISRQQVQQLNAELAASNHALTTTNQELLESNNRLRRTNAELDTFVYSASHDLKSPITNIEGLLLALRQQLPPAALQTELVPKLLGMMDGAVSRFQQTLGHLTDVSRVQQLALGQPVEAVALQALVEAVRLDILPELLAAEATLAVDIDPDTTVPFSAKNLRSILYNLLSNAIKYRAPDRPPLVQLRCRTAPGQVVLDVQDNGLGLSEYQQGELFRLFRRLHSHVTGSGVGLYMVKKIVDNAGGTLTVQSQLGVGSTFIVTLPILPA